MFPSHLSTRLPDGNDYGFNFERQKYLETKISKEIMYFSFFLITVSYCLLLISCILNL